MKKHLKWILPVLAVLMAAAAFMWFSFDSGEATADQTPMTETAYTGKIYWNIDRDQYYQYSDDAWSSFRVRGDQYFSMRFMADGEQINLFVRDREILDYAESLCFMGLEIDQEGVITQVIPVEDFTMGTAAINFIVESFTEDTIKLKQYGSSKSPSVEYHYNASTAIYDVSDSGVLNGIPGELEESCEIWAVMGRDGLLSHIYVRKPFELKTVYYNPDRQFDSTTKLSTRQPNEQGMYVFSLVADGQTVQVQTRDFELACRMDQLLCMSLTFDEAGNVIEVGTSQNATGGSSFASGYYVTELTEDGFTAANKAGTAVVSGEFSSKVMAYDVSGHGEYLGQSTQLQVGDQVHCLQDSLGRVCVIFVLRRPVISDIYFNYDRQYDSKTGTSKRVPAMDGYYYFDFVVSGTTKTLKTQDKEIVAQIDENSSRAVGLWLDGDVITRVFKYGEVSGYTSSIAGSYTVIAVKGNQITLENRIRSSNVYGRQVTFEITEDTKIYNASKHIRKHMGEETDIRVGDQLFSIKGMDDQVALVFVTTRAIFSDIYFNYNRQYDSQTGTSDREPAADGYYYFDFVVNGTTKTLKTKNKSIVVQIDENSSRAVGLQYSGDVITKVYKYGEIYGYSESVGGSYTVIAVDGNQVTLENRISSSSTYGRQVSFTVNSRTRIYNASNVFDTERGEKTNIQVGDTLFSIKDEMGQVTLVFVTGRSVFSDIYFNYNRQYNSATGTSDREPAEDGYYYFDFVVNGTTQERKTNDPAIVAQIDENSSRTVGLRCDGDVITKVYKYNEVYGYKESVGGSYTVIAIEGNTVTLENRITSSSTYGRQVTFDISTDTRIYNASNVFETERGEATQVQLGDTLFSIKNDQDQVSLIFVTGRVKPDLSIKGTCQACQQEVVWTEWDGAKNFTDGGHFILTKDINQTTMVNMAADTYACLNLNGYSMTIADNIGRAFNLYGTLNLMGEGTVTATNPNTKMAPVFYVQNGGLFRMYGGTLTSEINSLRAGIGMVQGTMEIYDGTVTGGVTTEGNGGNIELLGGTLVMYGGTVSNGTSAAIGGNIAVLNNKGTLRLLGGTITGGTAIVGSGVYAPCNVELSGDIQITGNTVSDLTLADGMLAQPHDLTEQALVGITLTQGTVFTDVVPEGTEKYFFSNGEGEIQRNTQGKLEIVIQEEEKTHCVCENDSVTWLPWEQADSLPSSGNYYLTDSVTLTQTVTVATGQELNLQLRGQCITGNVNRMFDVKGTMRICGCTEGGKLLFNHTAAANGSAFQVSGKLFAANFVVEKEQGAANAARGLIHINTAAAQVKLYALNISSGAASQDGGNIWSSGVLYLEDCTISGGTAVREGGNLYQKGATLTMVNCVVSDGQADGKGGNLYINSGVVFHLQGGTITGGSAPMGGGIYSANDVHLGKDIIIAENHGTDLYLAQGCKVLLESDLVRENAIGITMESRTGVFTEAVDEKNVKAFFSNEGLKLIQNAQGALELTEESENE